MRTTRTVTRHPLFFSAVMLLAAVSLRADEWDDQFRSPPGATQPRCYWYWMDGVFSKDGITRDLEAMKRVGIGEGYIGIISGQGGPTKENGLKALSDPWWDCLTHAVREGTRLGVDIGVFNSPGWSQSGGPWIKPDRAMRYLTLPEFRVTGPQHFHGALPAVPENFQAVSTFAFPAPAGDAETAISLGARVTKDRRQLTFELPKPITVRSVTIRPKAVVQVTAELQTSADGKTYRAIRSILIDRHKLGPGVGPVELAPIVAAIPATTARFFRLVLDAAADVGEVDLSPAARIDSIAEKSLIKVFQDPLPPFEFYSWPPQAEPEAPPFAIDPAKVIDLSGHVSAAGTLDWDAPAGEWVVVRAGMIPTGSRNGPAPPEATGLEVDKMNREALKTHFDAFVGELYRRIPATDRKSWKHVVADSYEMGPQNWTDGFAEKFRAAYGYDPLRWLPALGGRIVGSADQSNRFLWDLRRLVAERVARDYVGGLRDLCHEKGLKMWLENYGHWGFPSEFLLYGGQADEIGGEFWESGSLGGVELRAAASAAHIYGKPQVFAEAWTGGPGFVSTPWSLKKRGDWALCQGINQFVLHVYIHQPWEDRQPGVNAWFGTEFNRHNTWFDAAKPWIDYQRRCSVLLQQGTHVADVAYFIGEDTPKMTGICQPALPPGYDFDFINSDVLLGRAVASDGRLQLPDGTSYRLLVLPPIDTMRPEVLRKIKELVAAGVKVIGRKPLRSPSMRGFPGCDDELRGLADELWGKGLIRDVERLEPLLAELGTPPDLGGVNPSDILYVHRQDGAKHAYFLSNQTDNAVDLQPVFRVAGLKPELWDPMSGQVSRPAVYNETAGRTTVPLRLEPRGSVFVVFRAAGPADRFVEVSRDGKSLCSVRAQPVELRKAVAAAGDFTMACWVKPAANTPLFPQANHGIVGINAARNDVVVPAHGDSLVPGGGHAGSGFAVGRNGIVVSEHGAGYFAPVLVHPATLDGWTHVAVVYQHGRPMLYLNGKRASSGLQGPLIAHPSPFAAALRGELADCRQIPQAASAAEIAAWAARKPGPAPLADRFVINEAGAVEAWVATPGNYVMRTAGGQTRSFAVPSSPPAVALDGPWDVRFSAASGLKDPVRFAALQSWSDHVDPQVRYHSGDAIYATTFEMPAVLPGDGRRIILDLGRVESLAEISLNDRALGGLWAPPYQLDVTEALRPGRNHLRIRVWNTWHNRLLGAQQQAAGVTGQSPFTTTKVRIGKDAGLLPAGLLGPVSLRPVAVIVSSKPPSE